MSLNPFLPNLSKGNQMGGSKGNIEKKRVNTTLLHILHIFEKNDSFQNSFQILISSIELNCKSLKVCFDSLISTEHKQNAEILLLKRQFSSFR